MSNEPEETEEVPKEFIEVHLKIPKPEAPKIVIPEQKPHHIHISNTTIVHAPPKQKIGIPELDRENPKEQEGDMKSSGYSTAKKVSKFGSVLEKEAVQATQDFKRRGFTVKDSRAS